MIIIQIRMILEEINPNYKKSFACSLMTPNPRGDIPGGQRLRARFGSGRQGSRTSSRGLIQMQCLSAPVTHCGMVLARTDADGIACKMHLKSDGGFKEIIQLGFETRGPMSKKCYDLSCCYSSDWLQ